LFGLASFTAERRTREIGIRKVLGANVRQILGLLAGEFLWLIIVANIIAWPIAYWLATQWLNNYAYHLQPGLSLYILVGVTSTAIAQATVSLKAFRAALANPVESLRYE
jgi:putative ABC transport system permease protein